MYLTIDREDIIKKENIIGIFNIKSIVETEEYVSFIKKLKEENRIKNYANGEEKTIIIYQNDKEIYGLISNISSSSIEKRVKNKTI